MPGKNEDAMRDPHWFLRPPLARPYDDVLNAPIPEHVVSLRRPQSR
jgi:hypothetical protein